MADTSTEALIIRHIADLDRAIRLYEEKIHIALVKSVDNVMDKWAKNKGWGSEVSDKINSKVFPPDWQVKKKGKEQIKKSVKDQINKKGKETAEGAWFEMYEAEKSNGDAIGGTSYWAANLCGVGSGFMAMWWDWEKTEYGYNVRRWKQFIISYIERLQQAGVNYHDKTGLFFIPIRVSSDDLAQAIEDGAPEEALGPPINAALDRCHAAKPLFDKILASAKAQATKSE